MKPQITNFSITCKSKVHVNVEKCLFCFVRYQCPPTQLNRWRKSNYFLWWSGFKIELLIGIVNLKAIVLQCPISIVAWNSSYFDPHRVFDKVQLSNMAAQQCQVQHLNVTLTDGFCGFSTPLLSQQFLFILYFIFPVTLY